MLEAAGPEREQRVGADVGWGQAAAPKQSKDPQKLAITKKQVLLGCIINPTLSSKQVYVPSTTLTGSASENPASNWLQTNNGRDTYLD